jgi:hypothetical protein
VSFVLIIFAHSDLSSIGAFEDLWKTRPPSDREDFVSYHWDAERMAQL